MYNYEHSHRSEKIGLNDTLKWRRKSLYFDVTCMLTQDNLCPPFNSNVTHFNFNVFLTEFNSNVLISNAPHRDLLRTYCDNHYSPIIQSANASNANATFDQFCHSNRARTRRAKPSMAFEVARLFLVMSIIWSFGIMMQV